MYCSAMDKVLYAEFGIPLTGSMEPSIFSWCKQKALNFGFSKWQPWLTIQSSLVRIDFEVVKGETKSEKVHWV